MQVSAHASFERVNHDALCTALTHFDDPPSWRSAIPVIDAFELTIDCKEIPNAFNLHRGYFTDQAQPTHTVEINPLDVLRTHTIVRCCALHASDGHRESFHFIIQSGQSPRPFVLSSCPHSNHHNCLRTCLLYEK